MKKTYIIPTADVVEIKIHQQLLTASSMDVISGEIEDSGDILSREVDLEDEDIDFEDEDEL